MAGVPNSKVALLGGDGAVSIPWYLFFSNLASSSTATAAQVAAAEAAAAAAETAATAAEAAATSSSAAAFGGLLLGTLETAALDGPQTVDPLPVPGYVEEPDIPPDSRVIALVGMAAGDTQTSSSSSSGITLESGGTALGTATTLNFTGAGQTTTLAGAVGTINIPGGGSSGFSLPYGPPSASTWGTTYGSPASIANVSNVGAVLTVTPNASANVAGYLTAVSGGSPSLPLTITARIRVPSYWGNYFSAGLTISDGTKCVQWGVGTQGALQLNTWNNSGSFGSQIISALGGEAVEMWQIIYDGTNVAFATSMDGVNYTVTYETALSSLLSSLSYAGLTLNPQYSQIGSYQATLSCLYWNVLN